MSESVQEEKFEREFEHLMEGENPTPQEQSQLDAFGVRLRALFVDYEILRKAKEAEWLENLRQHKGVYDPETLAKIPANSSKVYPKITRARDNTVLSRLHEMLFPDLDRNWSIEPTPVPKVTNEIIGKIRLALVKQDPQTGTMVLPTPAELERAVQDFAKETCKEMESEMDDQLIEMDYSMKVGKPTLKAGVIYGTGLVKGPLPIEYYVDIYEAKEKEIVTTRKKKLSPFFQNVKIWNWYPDMNVTEPEDMEGCFERHVMSKHQVRKLAKRDDFKGDVIREYLKEKPQGDLVKKEFETKLETIDAGTQQKNVFESAENAASQKIVGRKYEVLEYWGYVDGAELHEAGVDIPEDMFDEEVPATIWLIDNKVIKAKKNELPGVDIPYHPFYFEKDETSIFAEGLPRLTRHSQITISAAARMLLNNAAICSGPQIEVNSTYLINEDINSIYPLKIWIREGRGVEAQYPALRVYHIESHIDEYIKIIDTFIKFGDIESTLPTWMLSEPSAMSNETAQGVSMRMSSMTMTIRDIVRNFDEHQESVIKALYKWNMEFNVKPEIKGDYSVKARGSSSLVMKEVQQQALNQFVLTLTPEDWAYIPRRDLLEKRIKVNDLDVALKSEEEAEQYRQSMVDMRAKELGYQDLDAEIKKKKAMALNLTTKAKMSNIEANQKSMGIGDGGGGTVVDPQRMALEREGISLENQKKVQDIQQKQEQHRRKMEKEGISTGIDVARQSTEMEMERERHDHDIEMDTKKTEAVIKKSSQKPAPKSAK